MNKEAMDKAEQKVALQKLKEEEKVRKEEKVQKEREIENRKWKKQVREKYAGYSTEAMELRYNTVMAKINWLSYGVYIAVWVAMFALPVFLLCYLVPTMAGSPIGLFLFCFGMLLWTLFVIACFWSLVTDFGVRLAFFTPKTWVEERDELYEMLY